MDNLNNHIGESCPVYFDGEGIELRGKQNAGVYGRCKVQAYDQVGVLAFDQAEVQAYDQVGVWAHGQAEVQAQGQAEVEAFDQVKVWAHGQAEVEAFDQAEVQAQGQVKVEAHDQAKVQAFDQVKVWTHGQVKVEAQGQAKVQAVDQAEVWAHGQAEVLAFGQAEVLAFGQAEVWAHGQAKVWAHQKSRVEAHEGATVELRGQAVILKAYDGTNVKAHDGITYATEGAKVNRQGGQVVLWDGFSPVPGWHQLPPELAKVKPVPPEGEATEPATNQQAENTNSSDNSKANGISLFVGVAEDWQVYFYDEVVRLKGIAEELSGSFCVITGKAEDILKARKAFKELDGLLEGDLWKELYGKYGDKSFVEVFGNNRTEEEIAMIISACTACDYAQKIANSISSHLAIHGELGGFNCGYCTIEHDVPETYYGSYIFNLKGACDGAIESAQKIPIVLEYIKRLALSKLDNIVDQESSSPEDDEAPPKMNEVEATETTIGEVVNTRAVEENQADDTGQDEELATIAAKIVLTEGGPDRVKPNGKNDPQDGRTPEERNQAVLDYLKKHGNRNKKITEAELGNALGASRRSIRDTKALQDYNREWEKHYGKSRTRNGKGRKPMVVSLSVEELAAQQREDDENQCVREYDRL